MRSSFEDTISLLKRWREERKAITVHAWIGRDSVLHFPASFAAPITESIRLKGVFISFELPLAVVSDWEQVRPDDFAEEGSFDAVDSAVRLSGFVEGTVEFSVVLVRLSQKVG
jgi:hypothetical protein